VHSDRRNGEGSAQRLLQEAAGFRAPSLRRGRPTLARKRVTDLIHTAASHGIALLVAPAGYGKSAALRHSYDNEAAVWLELDSRIETLEAFLKLLVLGATPRHVRGFASLLERTPRDRAVESLVPWVAARLRTIERTIIVDDLQRIMPDPRARAALQALVEATRHSVAWLLSARESPDLPLGTWIAKDWMSVPLGAADLAFREDEAHALASLLGIDIPESELATVLEDTAGWPIALQVSLETWQRTRTRLPGGMRTRDVLNGYIREQIWSALSAEERAVLELAALLPEPRVAVIAAAGYPAAGIELDRLSQKVPLFIDRSGSGEFRLHDLFREFINEKGRLEPIRHAQIASRAGSALAALGLSNEALHLFTAIRDERSIIHTLAECGYELVEAGDRETVAAAIAALTGSSRNDPVPSGIRGCLEMLEGAYAAAEADMRRALEAEESTPFHLAAVQRLAIFLLNRARYGESMELMDALLLRVPSRGAQSVELCSALAAVHGEIGNGATALQYASLAVSQMDAVAVDRRPHILTRVAAAYFRAGNIAEAEALGNEAALLATELGLDATAVAAYSVLYSIAEATHPDTERAHFYARAMCNAADSVGDKVWRASGLERLLYTATIRGDDHVLAEIEQKLAALGHVRLLRDTMQTRFGRVVREVGRRRFAQARRLLETIDSRDLTSADHALRGSLMALVCFAGGDVDVATEILEKPLVVPLDPDFLSRRSAALAHVYRALGYWLLGRHAAARRTARLDDAALTETDRVVVGAIGNICELAHAPAARDRVHQITEPLVTLGLAGYARFLRNVVGDRHGTVSLTTAELALLRAWRVGDTIAALAERLGRSPNTVNSHMRSIYRKTGSSSRAEALAYARDHGII
jgi:LuxR family maltose regulon positive regulatory protein